MRRLPFADITHADLASLVRVENRGIHREPWEELGRGELGPDEQRIIDYVTSGLERFRPSVVNEATVWARAIFPLLTLAETEGVEAQANVPLNARLGDVELCGTADGALGAPSDGDLEAPFLIVVEAKRGIEARSPVTQLYAEMLAAALMNARAEGRSSQQIYGAYTIGATWTFVRADIAGLDGERPSLSIVSSPELGEKLEAVTIAKILKSIVALRRSSA
ncbi:MAG: hypothetical protein U0359_15410 [Byssovorax sp.]